MPTELLLGYALTGFAVVMWSLAPSLVSRLSARDPSLDPLAFNAWRMVFALLFTAPLSLYYGFPGGVPWSSPLFHIGVVLGGVVSTVLGDTLFVYAVSRTGASIALPTAYLFVVWTGLIDFLLGATGWHVLAAAVLSVAGIWLVYHDGGRKDAAGFAAAVGASIVWTASNYGYKWAVEEAVRASGSIVAGSLHVALLRSIYTVALLAPVLARWDVRRGLPETVGASLTGYVLGALAYIAALSLLPPSIVSIGLSTNPLVVQAVAYIVAGERLRPRVVAGSALVTAALVLAAAPTT